MACEPCRQKALAYLEMQVEEVRRSYSVEATLPALMAVSAGAGAYYALGLLTEQEAAVWTLEANAAVDEVQRRR